MLIIPPWTFLLGNFSSSWTISLRSCFCGSLTGRNLVLFVYKGLYFALTLHKFSLMTKYCVSSFLLQNFEDTISPSSCFCCWGSKIYCQSNCHSLEEIYLFGYFKNYLSLVFCSFIIVCLMVNFTYPSWDSLGLTSILIMIIPYQFLHHCFFKHCHTPILSIISLWRIKCILESFYSVPSVGKLYNLGQIWHAISFYK